MGDASELILLRPYSQMKRRAAVLVQLQYATLQTTPHSRKAHLCEHIGLHQTPLGFDSRICKRCELDLN